MTTFLFIRHALVDAVGVSIAGWTPGIRLNREGRLQARSLGRGLRGFAIAAVYSSPLERAQETADIIADQLEIAVQVCDSIGEIRYGEWTGWELARLRGNRTFDLFNSFRSSTRVPGGELLIEVQARVVGEIERLRNRHPDETVILVSHGDVIRAAIAHLAGVPLDLLHRIEISPASVSVARIGESDAELVCVNTAGTIREFRRGSPVELALRRKRVDFGNGEREDALKERGRD